MKFCPATRDNAILAGNQLVFEGVFDQPSIERFEQIAREELSRDEESKPSDQPSASGRLQQVQPQQDRMQRKTGRSYRSAAYLSAFLGLATALLPTPATNSATTTMRTAAQKRTLSPQVTGPRTPLRDSASVDTIGSSNSAEAMVRRNQILLYLGCSGQPKSYAHGKCSKYEGSRNGRCVNLHRQRANRADRCSR